MAWFRCSMALLRTVVLGGISVQITDGERTQIDGIPVRSMALRSSLEQIVEYRILTVKCPPEASLLRCLLDGIRLVLIPCSLAADGFV